MGQPTFRAPFAEDVPAVVQMPSVRQFDSGAERAEGERDARNSCPGMAVLAAAVAAVAVALSSAEVLRAWNLGLLAFGLALAALFVAGGELSSAEREAVDTDDA